MNRTLLVAVIFGLLGFRAVFALDRTNEIFQIFQFPADQISRIDGETNDWNRVPENYVMAAINWWTITASISGRMRARRRFA